MTGDDGHWTRPKKARAKALLRLLRDQDGSGSPGGGGAAEGNRTTRGGGAAGGKEGKEPRNNPTPRNFVAQRGKVAARQACALANSIFAATWRSAAAGQNKQVLYFRAPMPPCARRFTLLLLPFSALSVQRGPRGGGEALQPSGATAACLGGQVRLVGQVRPGGPRRLSRPGGPPAGSAARKGQRSLQPASRPPAAPKQASITNSNSRGSSGTAADSCKEKNNSFIQHKNSLILG